MKRNGHKTSGVLTHGRAKIEKSSRGKKGGLVNSGLGRDGAKGLRPIITNLQDAGQCEVINTCVGDPEQCEIRSATNKQREQSPEEASFGNLDQSGYQTILRQGPEFSSCESD